MKYTLSELKKQNPNLILKIDELEDDTIISTYDRVDRSFGQYQLSNDGARFAIVHKDKIPICIAEQYELMNPFIFKDILILPGHDSVDAIHLPTGESTLEYIR